MLPVWLSELDDVEDGEELAEVEAVDEEVSLLATEPLVELVLEDALVLGVELELLPAFASLLATLLVLPV